MRKAVLAGVIAFVAVGCGPSGSATFTLENGRSASSLSVMTRGDLALWLEVTRGGDSVRIDGPANVCGRGGDRIVNVCIADDPSLCGPPTIENSLAPGETMTREWDGHLHVWNTTEKCFDHDVAEIDMELRATFRWTDERGVGSQEVVFFVNGSTEVRHTVFD